MSLPRFAVATFGRVFDAQPSQDVVDLETLVAGLTRFQLKRKLARRVERELASLDAAFASWQAGAPRTKKGLALARVAKEEGDDAARALHEAERARAKGAAKRDLRLWSPTLYRPGGRRTSGDVLALSCLVLDHDDGTAPEALSACWAGWLHVVHSTWSHTPALPKLRVCLPLAQPVRADHWRAVWAWGAARAGDHADPALKSPASTYALPATPSPDAARLAFVRPGALLDPVALGLARAAEPAPPAPEPPPTSHFRPSADDTWIDVPVDPPQVEPKHDEWADAFEDPF
ncbi:MAG: hypothetical protein AAF447_02090 [Myxococcota bacterium]